MAEVERNLRDSVPAGTHSPAIGMHATAGNAEAIAGAILRAQSHGHQAIVTATERELQALEHAQRLGANIVDPATREGDDPPERITHAAREAGYPGVIYQEEPTNRIDYDRSSSKLTESNAYWTTAVPKETAHGPKVIAGIPAFNEEVGIGSVILQCFDHCDEVVVVDDGSSDATVEVASAAGAIVIEHETNQGKGAALKTLFDYIDSTEYDALVLLDGDGQHTPSDIPTVLDPVLEGDSDLVIGSRYLEGAEVDETPAYRRVGQRVLDILTMGSSQVKVTDSQSGFRVLSPSAVESISLNTTSFGVESEMIDSAANEDLTIDEQPIDVRYDGIDGQTQNPLRHGLTVVTFILQLVRDRHPLLFFGVPGLLLLGIGAVYGLDAILVYQSMGTFYPSKVLVAGFLSILGSLGLFVGLVLNRVGNMISQLET